MNESTFTWATVTAIGPLRIKLDGDTAALPFTPEALVDTAALAVSDRVRVELSNNRPIILGEVGGAIRAPLGQYAVASLAALDAITTAVIGDEAAFTSAPSTGISSSSAGLKAQAYSGSGSSIKWHFTSPILAATLVNMDTFIAACVAITDLATAFIVGQTFFVSGSKLLYRFTSTAGAYVIASDRVVPSAVTNGSFDADTGVVTSTAQSFVRVRDSFPPGFRMFFCKYDVNFSAAVGLLFTLAVDATDATSGYDYDRTSAVSTTVAAVLDLNQASGSLSPIGLATRHVGSFLIVDPNFAGQTVWDASSVVAPNPMTTSSGKTWVGGSHRTLSAYNSIKFFGSSGNITINRLTIEGVSS